MVPIIHLIDPFHDGTELVAEGAVIAEAGTEAWVVVTPESSPEPPHRVLALMFGAAFPSASELQLLIEGYGLHRSGVADPDLSGRALPALDEAHGDERASVAVSFVRFLIAREGAEAFLKLLSAPAGRVDETVREVYGPSLGQLEQLWRRKQFSGANEVETAAFLKLSIRYLRPYKLRQAEIFGYMLLSLAFVAAFPFVTQRLFDTALPSGEFSQVLTLLITLGVAFVVSLVAGVRQAYQTAWVSNAVTRDIRQTVFSRVQVLPENWFSAHSQGDVLSRLFSDVAVVESGLSQAIGQGVFQVISLIASAIIMLSLNVTLGIVVLVVAPIVGIVYRSMANGAMERSIAVQEQSSSLLSVAAENYRAIPVVKMFGLADRERRRFAQQSDRLFRSTRRLTMWGGLFGLSVNLIVTLLRLGVLGFGAWLILQGDFTTGGLVAFLSIMGEVLSPVTVLVSLSQEVQSSMGSLVRINEVVDELPEPDDPNLPPLPALRQNVRLTSLGMSYDTGHRALDGMDATISCGTRVAIVGPSGSGKSTVLRLLMRLHEPDEGAILVDGIDVRTCSLASWRDQLGVVFQDSFLFDATVRENIALGRPDATDAEILAAATAAEVDGFVAALPRGWDTLVGEGGSNLSGGQRQRVAIARALLRNPRLLLLDEATSALDPATERQINDTLRQVARGRTVVAVTHRLASITDYDSIIVLVDGRLAEQGTHDELLRRRGAYAHLWAEQTGQPVPAPPPVDLGEALRRVQFFTEAEPRLIERAVAAMVPFVLETGRSVEEGDGIMVVCAGRGEVVTSSTMGTVVDAALDPGDAFGVRAAMGAPAASSLRAVEPLELMHLPRAELDELVRSEPALAARWRTSPDDLPGRSATRIGRATMARPAVGARGSMLPPPTRPARSTVAVFSPPSSVPSSGPEVRR
jgi:ABC-type multidrug transport system fused ATPase/permease subunit